MVYCSSRSLLLSAVNWDVVGGIWFGLWMHLSIGLYWIEIVAAWSILGVSAVEAVSPVDRLKLDIVLT